MLADPLAAHVDVAGGSSTTENYTLLNLQQNASDRLNTSATAGLPKRIKISHSVVGKGAASRVRHLARMEAYVVEDSVENTAKPFAVYVVADVPNGVTATQKSDMFKRFVGLLRGASGDAANAGVSATFWDRWLNGES